MTREEGNVERCRDGREATKMHRERREAKSSEEGLKLRGGSKRDAKGFSIFSINRSERVLDLLTGIFVEAKEEGEEAQLWFLEEAQICASRRVCSFDRERKHLSKTRERETCLLRVRSQQKMRSKMEKKTNTFSFRFYIIRSN